MADRIGAIDSLKGIGIILVMMSHMLSCKYLTPLYGGFIPLFFISAGLTSRSMNYDRYSLQKKFARLMIPYFAYCVVILSIYTLCLDTSIYDVIGVIYARCRLFKDSTGENIHLLPREIAPLWFLPAMFVVYIGLCFNKLIGGVYNPNSTCIFHSNHMALVIRHNICTHGTDIDRI